MGVWEPDGPAGPRLRVGAFAEPGGELQTPGPLLRVPAGTDVRVTIRNALRDTLRVHGLGARRGLGGDTVVVAPGASRGTRFRAGEAGTFYYAARTSRSRGWSRDPAESQLHGALVVDPAGTIGAPRDRVFVISQWFTIDTTTVSGLGPHATLAFNGRTWPATERIEMMQGDTARWRVINATQLPHPLHLHGAYFRVDAKGDGARDTTYAPAERRLAVTDLVTSGQTVSLVWSPERSGNWLFHCHFASHMSRREAFDADRRMPSPASLAANAHGGHDAIDRHMSGLVLGIHVSPRRAPEPPRGPERALRLLVRSRANVYGEYVGYAYVLGGSPAEAVPDSLPVPGPTLELTRGQPVAITLVNRAHEAIAVHWHGLEIESFPDGVPGWSGDGRTTLPSVPPGDSLTVRFTPPRAGTFMYHSHANEMQQISSGLYGAIVVSEPGVRRDPATDHVLVLSDDGPLVRFIAPPPGVLLNGQAAPDTIELRAGVAHRLRLVNIRSDAVVRLAVLDGDSVVTWRPLAKDGADLPASQRAARPARLAISSGEIVDVELVPPRVGTLVMKYADGQDEDRGRQVVLRVR